MSGLSPEDKQILERAEREEARNKKLAKLREAKDAAFKKYTDAKRELSNKQSSRNTWKSWLRRAQNERETGDLGAQYNSPSQIDDGLIYAFSFSPSTEVGDPSFHLIPLTEVSMITLIQKGIEKIASLEKGIKRQTATVETRSLAYGKAAREWSLFLTGNTEILNNHPANPNPSSPKDTPSTLPEDKDVNDTDGNKNDGKTVLKNADAKRVRINFNIPMVKSAYFPDRGIQDDVISEKVNGWSTRVNGRKMWAGDTGGKGVIQPNLAVARTQLSKTYKDSKAIKRDLDDKLYGFRFLYNPSSISMGWGISQEVDPTTIGLALDKGIPLTGNLSPSSISFELILNRIEDINHIDENGWRRIQLTEGYFDETTRSGVYPTFSRENPWPTPSVPSFEDLNDIYERGTMYDIDFLFAALMPGAPKYRSNLNGILADRGYMSGYTCELHLGPRMRYSVQIASLNVEHIMFNERMVPLLSKVDITATRLPDVKQGLVKGFGINTNDYSAKEGS